MSLRSFFNEMAQYMSTSPVQVFDSPTVQVFIMVKCSNGFDHMQQAPWKRPKTSVSVRTLPKQKEQNGKDLEVEKQEELTVLQKLLHKPVLPKPVFSQR